MPEVEHYFRIVSALGLDELMAEMDDVSGEVYALESPSVRLARWADAGPTRMYRVLFYDGMWWCGLWDEPGTASVGSARRPDRDAAIAAALDQAEAVVRDLRTAEGTVNDSLPVEAGATTEGEQHDA
jgi:hypothetical protein